ncbi:MAG: monovalent cation/H+ antiporter subunit D [Gammaproteobacteria bacterium]|nr:MAG: monovalent cation/H+ antiporter subunit D [Gammaproteobacteria bacterium]
MTAHLVIAPVLAPFLAGAVLLLCGRSVSLRRVLSTLAVLLQCALAVTLLVAVSDGGILVYRLGDWPPPWGIVLVADRLAAWMILITTLLALCAVVQASGGTDQQGRHFHVFFQMQLFGLAGAFLTGDLFNLFVFFEVLLIASYCLQLHGGGAARTRAGLHYVVLNLLGSAVFLFAAGLIYASLGTLNMAEIAVRAAQVAAQDLGLARSGGLLLLTVFALKAALLPLLLWLPPAYAATTAPVAALFAILTKVGLYAILRGHTLWFGVEAGEIAGLFAPWLLPLGLATIGIGAIGVLAAPDLRRLAAWLVIVSSGTLLTAFGFGIDGTAAGLYYLAHGTFAVALLFLLAGAIRRRRPVHGDFLEPGIDLPRHGLWGGIYFATAIAAVGLPPLSGFLAKFLILQAAVGQPLVWVVVLAAALVCLIALARSGSQMFLNKRTASPDATVEPESASRELLAIGGLLGLIVALTVGAGPVVDFSRAAAAQLADPSAYIAAVIGAGR